LERVYDANISSVWQWCFSVPKGEEQQERNNRNARLVETSFLDTKAPLRGPRWFRIRCLNKYRVANERCPRGLQVVTTNHELANVKVVVER